MPAAAKFLTQVRINDIWCAKKVQGSIEKHSKSNQDKQAAPCKYKQNLLDHSTSQSGPQELQKQFVINDTSWKLNNCHQIKHRLWNILWLSWYFQFFHWTIHCLGVWDQYSYMVMVAGEARKRIWCTPGQCAWPMTL